MLGRIPMKPIVIKTNESAEKYEGTTALFKIWSYCQHCGCKFSQEFYGTLPSSNIKGLCNDCLDELGIK